MGLHEVSRRSTAVSSNITSIQCAESSEIQLVLVLQLAADVEPAIDGANVDVCLGPNVNPSCGCSTHAVFQRLYGADR